MTKTMIRNSLIMLLATIALMLGLVYYLGYAGSVAAGEAGGTGATTGDGISTVTTKGFLSDITVTVTMDGNTLTAISIDASGETPEYGGKAAELLEESILAAGTTEGVDGMAGATISSTAILQAAAEAMG